MRHAHLDVIDDMRKIIRRVPVALDQNEIIECFFAGGKRSPDHITPCISLELRYAEAKRTLPVPSCGFCGGRRTFASPKRATATRRRTMFPEQERPFFLLGSFPQRIEFLLRVRIDVCLPCRKKLFPVAAIEIQVFGLFIDFRVIPGDAEPGERLYDVLDGAWHFPFLIRVVDAQDKRTSLFTREKPRVERRAHAAHVQESRRARRETGYDIFLVTEAHGKARYR